MASKICKSEKIIKENLSPYVNYRIRLLNWDKWVL